MISAVIVSFNAGSELISLVSNILRNVDFVVLVDNGSQNIEAINEICRTSKVHAILNSQNLGLAEALNLGIKESIRLEADYICLLDQDTQPDEAMIPALLSELNLLRENGEKVAVIAPRLADVVSQKSIPFISCENSLQERIYSVIDQQPITLAHAITSGSVIPVDVFADIGLMWSSLFIDYIDIEWCFRARANGYKIYGSSKTTLYHQIGEKRIDIPLTDRQIPVHSPSRLFYLFRNLIWLCRSRSVGRLWFLRELFRLCLKFLAELIFAPFRMKRIMSASRGIMAGLSISPPERIR